MVSNLSPIGARAASAFSKASAFQLAGALPLPANNDHQGDDAARGTARGALRRLPHGHVLPDQPNRLALPPGRWPVRFSSSRIGHHFPAERHCAARGGFYSVRTFGANRSSAQSLPHQPLEQIAAAVVVHHSLRLSSSLASRWIDPNENGLTHAQISFAPGANAND